MDGILSMAVTRLIDLLLGEQVVEANIGKYRGYSEKQTSNKLSDSTIQCK